MHYRIHMHPSQEAVSRVIDELRLLFAANGGRNLTVSQLRMMLQQHAQQHGAQGHGQGRPGATAGGAVGQGVVANLQVRALFYVLSSTSFPSLLAPLSLPLSPPITPHTHSTHAMSHAACRLLSNACRLPQEVEEAVRELAAEGAVQYVERTQTVVIRG